VFDAHSGFDGGVANFFITREDLVQRNFHKVMYTWDCS